jgi:predicted metal-dependent TIM-barrel fold hydrolase
MVAQQILDLLKPYAAYKERMVIDHCTPEIIGEVLTAGFYAGVTLSPVKASAEDVKEIVSNYENYLSRIMLNTDSESPFYDNQYPGGYYIVCRAFLMFSISPIIISIVPRLS